MSKKPWFVEKSFPLIVFGCPLTVLYIGSLLLLPKETLSSKPSLSQLLIGLACGLVGILILIVIFSFLWALLMRLLYGSQRVREWVYEDEPNFGRSGNAIERFIRKICELAL